MIELELNKELYGIDVISQAIREYDQLAKITTRDAGNHIVCVFDKCVYDEAQTAAEFENFVIDSTNEYAR